MFSKPSGPVPLIDVLVPAYNAAPTIRSSIASIQAQTVASIRIIVIDDGSTDGTRLVLDELAALDPRIVAHSQANTGIVDALNTAVAASTAPFIARHDADDIAYPERLERQLNYLLDHADCAAVGANAWHIGEDGMRLGTRTLFIGDVDPDPFAVPAREPYLMHPFLLVRREILIAAGRYRHCFHAEDADLYWRLLSFGRLYNLPDVLGEYRVHAGSISSVSARNGRIAAKYSQMAALSHRRRLEGRADLTFDRADLAVLNQADSLHDVVEHAFDRLDDTEKAYLKKSSAAKLVDIASYRPFRLSFRDCQQLAVELRDLSGLPDRERAVIRRTQAEVLRRYIDAGHWPEIKAFRFPLSVFARLPRRYWWKFRNHLRVRLQQRRNLQIA